jgi:hypothetical protein
MKDKRHECKDDKYKGELEGCAVHVEPHKIYEGNTIISGVKKKGSKNA